MKYARDTLKIENELRWQLKKVSLRFITSQLLMLLTIPSMVLKQLVHWKHPDKGVIFPECFIPICRK